MPSEQLTGRFDQGLLLGGLIGTTWIATLIIGLRLEFDQLSAVVVLAIILVRSYVHTGLFIVAHDAMHNSLIPDKQGLNHLIGRICLWCYAGLDYDYCRTMHRKHHLSPESENDPDFFSSEKQEFGAWLIHFLSKYLNPAQLFRLCLLLTVLVTLTPIKHDDILKSILLFYIIPLIISTAQLFIVGTYLPHRNEERGLSEGPSIKSLNLHPIASILACYHFGYHREHHSNPHVPWFRLPEYRIK